MTDEWWFGGRREAPAPAVRAVQITTRTGQAIKGVLVAAAPEGLIVRAASIGVKNQQGQVIWHPLDGDTVVPHDNVDFWQDGLDVTVLDGIVDAVNRRNAGQ